MLVGRYAAVFLTLPVAFKRDILDLTLPTFILNNQVPFLPALLIAIGQDQDMAEHMGVNLLRYKVYTFKIPSGQGDL